MQVVVQVIVEFIQLVSYSLCFQVIRVVCRYKRRLHALWSYLRGTDQAPAVSQLRQKVLQGTLLCCAVLCCAVLCCAVLSCATDRHTV